MTLILGRKKGMTHLFRDDGTHIGVTVVSAGPCTVTQVRTQETDGYDAIQLSCALRLQAERLAVAFWCADDGLASAARGEGMRVTVV